MRILFTSHAFFPSIGGLETFADLFARSFYERGHRVTVVTQTPGTTYPGNVLVLRHPRPGRLLAEVKRCDVFVQNQISLQTVWPALLLPRRVVFIHQTWIGGRPASQDPISLLKRLVLRRGANLAISRAIAEDLPVPATVIPNCYDDLLFQAPPPGKRPFDLGFIGRLVSDKGAGDLLEGLCQIAGNGVHPRVLIIGDGPDRASLEQIAHAAGLDDQIHFSGSQPQHEAAELLRQVEVLVVPSRWPEPFGIVALEGIASGCVILASDAGGLPEAVGSCGLTFPNGNVPELARLLGRLLNDPALRTRLREHAPAHLERFSTRAVMDRYEAFLRNLTR